MEIVKKSQAGSFESSDILILAEPVEANEGRTIEIDSAVQKEFGGTISQLIDDILDEYKVTDIHIVVKDKGAIEPVIKARMETVLKRASNNQSGTMY